MEEETTKIITALSSLTPLQLSDLTASLLADSRHHRRRISAVLSSPILFSLILSHLHSLSLPLKSLLIARHLLSSLHLLTRHLSHAPPNSYTSLSPRDLDAVLLLLLLCDLRHHRPDSLRRPVPQWRAALADFWLDKTLTLHGIGASGLVPYVEAMTRCWRFVGDAAVDYGGRRAASPAAVVALPSVEVGRGEAAECAVCREEMGVGRDVCELPCQHLFHWLCILPWLRKSNTCPCCRFALPTDDVYGEIQRLWGVLVRMSTGTGCAGVN